MIIKYASKLSCCEGNHRAIETVSIYQHLQNKIQCTCITTFLSVKNQIHTCNL
jgi:hypothetical protein